MILLGREEGLEREVCVNGIRSHNCESPQLYEAIKGQRSACGQAHNLGHKGNISFILFLALPIFYFRSFHGVMRVDPTVAGMD